MGTEKSKKMKNVKIIRFLAIRITKKLFYKLTECKKPKNFMDFDRQSSIIFMENRFVAYHEHSKNRLRR